MPAVKAHGRLWFHLDGVTHVVESAASSARRSSGPVSGEPGVIKAPMPGKITRVAVALGDTVQKGQALIVMEAMKMEYTLESDLAGPVTEIGFAVGSQVALGQTLVRVGGK